MSHFSDLSFEMERRARAFDASHQKKFPQELKDPIREVKCFPRAEAVTAYFTFNVATRTDLPGSEDRAALVDLADAVEHRDAITAFLTMPNRIMIKVAVGRFRKALLRRRFRLGAEPGVLRHGQVLAMDAWR